MTERWNVGGGGRLDRVENVQTPEFSDEWLGWPFIGRTPGWVRSIPLKTAKNLILTGRDDNLVGEVVPGSTGTVTTFGYGSDYLRIVGTTPVVLKHLRILYCGGSAINLANGVAGNELWHSQIAHSFGIWAENSSIKVRNVLLDDVTGLIEGVNFSTDIQHVTARTVWWGFAEDGGSTPGPFIMVNSLLSEVPFKAGYTLPPSVVWSETELPNVFETVGAGRHYLKDGTYRNYAAAATVDAPLQADLARRTTHAPVVLSGTITSDVVLSPRAIGDSAARDLGFHYPIADYAVSAEVDNTTVLLTNGVVVLTYGNYGFRLKGGAQLISMGWPTRMNRVIPYLHAQEQTTNWGSAYFPGTATFNTLQEYGSTSPDPVLRRRFTVLDRRLDGNGYHFYVGSDMRASQIDVRDSQILGGSIIAWGEFSYTANLGITNNVFENVFLGFYIDPNVSLFNNLFRYCEFDFQFMESGNPAGGGDWRVKDNIFDRCRIGDWADPWSGHTHNAYVASKFFNWDHFTEEYAAQRFVPEHSTEFVLSTLPYESGPLGNYYLPESVPGENQLIDGGSRSAAAAGLFHFTTRAGQAKDTGTVDLGAHFVSAILVNGQIIPLDTDGDGKSDYVEDINGDGKFPGGTGHGETRWRGIPKEPIVRFSSNPLNYFPGAGLVPLDSTVVVEDPDDSDENFSSIETVTIETAPGDFVRFVPDSELMAANSSTHAFDFVTGQTASRVKLNGGNGTPLWVEFTDSNEAASKEPPARIQALLRKLSFVTERTPFDEVEQRSVRVSVRDGIGATNFAAREVRVLSERPSFSVDAGPDLAVPYNDQGISLSISGKVIAAFKTSVTVEWTLVEPVLWKLDEVPEPPVGSMIPSWDSVCPPDGTIVHSDILGQTGPNPSNPRNERMLLEAGQEDVLLLNKVLPRPEHNKHCYVNTDNRFEAWRYRFRLTATDGQRTAVDEVIVRILPENSDEVPEVRIHPMKAIRPAESMVLGADVINESGEALDYRWTVKAPEGAIGPSETWNYSNGTNWTTDPNPTVFVAGIGQYEIQLCVSDRPQPDPRAGCDRATISVCTRPASPADVVFVIDRSISPQGLVDAESAILAMLQGVEPGLFRLAVVDFSEDPNLTQELTADYQAVVDAIRVATAPDDQWRHWTLMTPALDMAVQELTGHGRPDSQKVIVLFSDGAVPDFDMTASLSLAKVLRRQGIKIVTMVNEDTYFSPELFRFSIGDPSDFYAKLKWPSPEDAAVANHLLGLPAMAEIANYGGDPNSDLDLLEPLLRSLNRVIRGTSLFVPGNVFATEVPLSTTTLSLLDKDPVGYEVQRLNRSLLADALPFYVFPHGIGSYSGFLASVATSPDDVYVSNASGHVAILQRLASGVCAGDPPTLLVELGPDQQVYVNQQITARAAPGTTDDGDPGTIVSHRWSIRRISDTHVPASGPGAFAAPGVDLVVEGSNDPEITTTPFEETGQFLLEVEIRSASGAVAIDSVVIRVEAAPPPGENYDAIRYFTTILSYDIVPVVIKTIEQSYVCASIPSGSGNGTQYPPSIGLPSWPDCSWHKPWMGAPCNNGPGWILRRTPPEPRTACELMGFAREQEFYIPRLVGVTVLSSLGLDGRLKPLKCVPAWPNITGFQLPDQFGLTWADIWDGRHTAINPFRVPWEGIREADAVDCDGTVPITPNIGSWKIIREWESWEPDIPCLDDPWLLRTKEDLRRLFRRFDGMGLFTTTIQLPATGAPWKVDAGGERRVVADLSNGQTALVNLDGTLSHKRRPGMAFSASWSIESGPPDGAFHAGNPFTTVDGLRASATLAAPGTYLFKLTVEKDDPECTELVEPVIDYLTVQLNAANLSAGPDQVIDFLPPTSPGYVTTHLKGTAAEVAKPVQWTVIEKPVLDLVGPSFFPSATELEPEVRFYFSGTYKFRLKSDSNVASDIVRVEVNAPPAFPVEGIDSRAGIWTPDLDLTADGIQLIAEVWDDDLPSGMGLQYWWECITKPAEADCLLETPRAAATRARFSFSGSETQHFAFRLTVSDGRLTASTERGFEISPSPQPLLIFEAPTDAAGMALDLFPPDGPLSQTYRRIEGLAWKSALMYDGSSTPQDLQIAASAVSAASEFSGTVLRFTSPINATGCQRGLAIWTANFIDRYGRSRAGEIHVVLVPRPESQADYERTHHFKFLVRAGQERVEVPLRDLIGSCPDIEKRRPVKGPMINWSALQIMETPLGGFMMTNQLATDPSDPPKEVLALNPLPAYTGQPVRTTFTYQLEGAPGRARFEFLLVPNDLGATPGGAIGGMDPSAMVEVGETLELTTYQVPFENRVDYLLAWIVSRLDGPQPVPEILVHHPAYPNNPAEPNRCIARIQFPAPGMYLVQLTINGQSAGATRVVVVPAGTLTPVQPETRQDFDLPDDVPEGPDPDAAPGRASILNLAVPGYRPTEIKDGQLFLKAQAAGPTTENACSFKVFLFPAGAGDPVADLADQNRAWDITTAFGLGDIDSEGWCRQCRGRESAADTDMGTADLSSFTNGTYFIQVWARGMTIANEDGIVGKSFKHPLLLQTQRKLGKVQFSETDFSLAAADGRLRISRGYDSDQGPPSTGAQPVPELGRGWALSSFDLAVQLYESRAGMTEDALSLWTDDEDEDEEPQVFAIRLGGSRHVTLNLPWNGRRVSFGQGTGTDRLPFWRTP